MTRDDIELRQRGFVPNQFDGYFWVIGVGALGSYIAWLLGKLRFRNIVVWDHDTVVLHNIPNQMYLLSHVGMPKVKALCDLSAKGAGISPIPIARRFTGSALNGYVFVAVDSMKDRMAIWRSSVRNHRDVRLMIECRMEAAGGHIFTVRPTDDADISAYERTLYPDEESSPNECTRQSIAPTVSTIAGLAVFAALSHLRGESVADRGKTFISLEPLILRSGPLTPRNSKGEGR